MSVQSTAITHVRLTFRDESVPPQYHRSYQIDIQDNLAQFTVTSYTRTLHDSQQPLEENRQHQLFRQLAELSNAATPKKINPEIGGASYRLELYDHDTLLYCAEQTKKNLILTQENSVMTIAVKAITSLIPDFQTVLKQ